ncbi:hypothetical protein DPEC_G00359860 [Dallia pectoralis]|uniref:Uncharacterized protein n=1 Tax=Dallia pectoralis TaxID=75939 RepID=A0ACC2F130_DALPE|nr:hypothetical protein DPEC_G00359860 [Dallia pectoralis]
MLRKWLNPPKAKQAKNRRDDSLFDGISDTIFGRLKKRIKQRKLKQEEKSREYHLQLLNTPAPKIKESRTTSKRPSPDSKKQTKPSKCKDYSIFAAAPL